jgi:hypothetical protein
MRLIQLIAEWRARLPRVRALADNDPSTGWLWSIRARILKFLISRYEQASEVTAAIPPRAQERLLPPPIPFCTVVSADGPPPRSGAAIVAILEDIGRCNRRERRAWWFGHRRS